MNTGSIQLPLLYLSIRYIEKKNVYIIIGSAYAPDIDFITDPILGKIGITILIYGQPIQHGDFHNILVMIIYAILIALLLNTINIRMKDSFILASIGFAAHLFGDALVFNPGYRLFWPISDIWYRNNRLQQ